MKPFLSQTNKVLIGVAVFLYLIAFYIGALGIIVHIVVLGSAIRILARTKKNNELAVLDLIILTVFICIFISIRIGVLWSSYGDYKINKANQLNNTQQE